MKALLPVFVALSLLAYTTQSRAQDEPPPVPTGGEPVSNTDTGNESSDDLRECLLEKAWAECGLVPISQVIAQSNSPNSSRTDRNTWLRGPWAKTIPEYY